MQGVLGYMEVCRADGLGSGALTHASQQASRLCRRLCHYAVGYRVSSFRGSGFWGLLNSTAIGAGFQCGSNMGVLGFRVFSVESFRTLIKPYTLFRIYQS